MALEDSVESRRLERDRYLVALYQLTAEEPLRWSTHRKVAEAADIPEDRIMTISQELSGLDMVDLRTLGGIDGYVELTPRGLLHVESMVDRGSTGTKLSVEEPVRLSEADWAERYQPLLRLSFEGFIKEGNWPDLETLQRALDRQDRAIDVKEAVEALPRSPGQPNYATLSHLAPRLRLLSHLEESTPYLADCLVLVRRGVEIYFSDAENLQLTNSDPSLAFLANDRTTQVAARLLMQDYPNPFAGGGYSPDGSWSLGINGETARRFRDVESIADYFDTQDAIRAEAQQQFSLMTAGPEPNVGFTALVASGAPGEEFVATAIEPTVFVVMPFTETWSTGVYDFIRRAVRSLGYLDTQVIRADKITKPGRIDQQILEAILNAHIVVGDITGSNPNVMWELGFAEAAKVPIVVLNQQVEDSPFDLANTRQVSYRLAPTDDDERRLAEYIRAALAESALGGST